MAEQHTTPVPGSGDILALRQRLYADLVEQQVIDVIDGACPQGHDRSAGRWCAECGQNGSHHTDRHAEFTCCTPSGSGQPNESAAVGVGTGECGRTPGCTMAPRLDRYPCTTQKAVEALAKHLPAVLWDEFGGDFAYWVEDGASDRVAAALVTALAQDEAT
jgi:hypothetical protein